MATINFPLIEQLFRRARKADRSRLFEHECYELLRAIGAEAVPAARLVPVGSRPSQPDLDAIPGSHVVLKIVSPDIIHKTEAGGVRIVAKNLLEVDAAIDAMLVEGPAAYAEYLAKHGEAGAGATAEELGRRLVGVLLCEYVDADARGFATELFVGVRRTSEFGPIITAGLGGVEMETLARETRKGAAVAIAPTGLVSGPQFFELFKRTLSYQRLSGAMRGSRRLVDDEVLVECFQATISLANHFSELNPYADFQIVEFEVNPHTVTRRRLAPLDGVCVFSASSSRVNARPITKIDSLLRPTSAAVIGVSSTAMNMGRIILGNILGGGFDRARTWVVRPGVERIDGVACVPTISDLPAKVDLLVVAVGAAQVPEVIDEVVDRDAANAVILIPGGLGETAGSHELADRLKAKIRAAHEAEDGGPVFIGGNSLGVISHPGRYDTMFIPESKLAKSRGDRRRNACFISQSGAYIIANLSRMPWFDPAYALSIGNQIDLTAADLLDRIKDDPEIDVFAVYMEGFQPGDGLRFAQAARATVAKGKDVVFYKAGRTTAGRSATAGHTASVAGDYAVCEAAIAEAGAFVAADFGEFSDLLRLSVAFRGKRVTGRRLVAMSNAGFESVGMADSIEGDRTRLVLAELGTETRAALQTILELSRLDGLVDVKNPFDVTPMANDETYAQLVGAILGDPGVDLMVAGIVPLTPAMQTLPPDAGHSESVHHPGSIARRLPEIAGGHDTPLVAVVDSGRRFDPLAGVLEAGGLPVFRSADRAVQALRRWVGVKLAAQRRSS
ncbi:MAG: acetate--CoA ligase family protein [Thermoanaerobaculales bacterium]|jgi:acyl-CoA synthetase (NDP forming)|nr:acetate--CoA ligase family protein [Thermoanaerobaculales bacterium]